MRETLAEAVVADLGDAWNSRPYMIVCLSDNFAHILL